MIPESVLFDKIDINKSVKQKRSSAAAELLFAMNYFLEDRAFSNQSLPSTKRETM